MWPSGHHTGGKSDQSRTKAYQHRPCPGALQDLLDNHASICLPCNGHANPKRRKQSSYLKARSLRQAEMPTRVSVCIRNEPRRRTVRKSGSLEAKRGHSPDRTSAVVHGQHNPDVRCSASPRLEVPRVAGVCDHMTRSRYMRSK